MFEEQPGPVTGLQGSVSITQVSESDLWGLKDHLWLKIWRQSPVLIPLYNACVSIDMAKCQRVSTSRDKRGGKGSVSPWLGGSVFSSLWEGGASQLVCGRTKVPTAHRLGSRERRHCVVVFFYKEPNVLALGSQVKLWRFLFPLGLSSKSKEPQSGSVLCHTWVGSRSNLARRGLYLWIIERFRSPSVSAHSMTSSSWFVCDMFENQFRPEKTSVSVMSLGWHPVCIFYVLCFLP